MASEQRNKAEPASGNGSVRIHGETPGMDRVLIYDHLLQVSVVLLCPAMIGCRGVTPASSVRETPISYRIIIFLDANTYKCIRLKCLQLPVIVTLKK
jgi:hypothetical protein